MEPITYHMKGSSLHLERLFMLVLSIAWVVTLLIWAVFGEMQIDLGLLIIFGLLFAIFIPWAVRVVRHPSKAENFLRLDGEGLTQVSWGRMRRWAWLDLSSFEIRGIEKFWFLTADRYVPIVKPGGGSPSRFLGNWRRFEGMIRDKYDAPLDEIAATLNEYRERALGGGAETSETQSPEPA